MSERLIRLPEVKKMVGLGTTSIYMRVKCGGFPKPVKLGGQSSAVAWLESEVQEWIKQRIDESRPANNEEHEVGAAA